MKGFEYLSDKDIYLDAACQSLRPQPVIDTLNKYYTTHNSCGERVKYKWGRATDDKVAATRTKVLKYLKLNKKDYFVSFTLNTTYGLNLIINQIHPRFIRRIYTSDVEHNSAFLSTIAYGKLHKIKREVLTRAEDGSIPLKKDYRKALVVVNIASNFDSGLRLKNLRALVSKVRKSGGIIILDAAQAVGHNPELLYRCRADAICFSAHKAYGPSLGVMCVRRDLLPQLRTSFIGGGMVNDVHKSSFDLSATSNPDHVHTIFEPGLQAWGEIIAFGSALDWLMKIPKRDKKLLYDNTQKLYDFLTSRHKVHVLSQAPATTISFYIDGFDSHLIGEALGNEHIMVRTGYFCAHYYLDHVKKYPPLIRCSLGYHTRPSDIDRLIAALDKVTK